MTNQFSNISCYEEFEIQSVLSGISKIDILKEIGHKVGNYYFFVSNNGIFNWFNLNGNHIENPCVLDRLWYGVVPYDVTKCIIPDSVISIEDCAFNGYSSLEEIIIPNNVTEIGYHAFYECKSLKSITIPDRITTIHASAFSHCDSLKEIIIPNSVTKIDFMALAYNYSLKRIIISNSVTSIGYGAFWYCPSLKEVVFKGKTLEEVEQMYNYPFGIKNKNIIKCEL